MGLGNPSRKNTETKEEIYGLAEKASRELGQGELLKLFVALFGQNATAEMIRTVPVGEFSAYRRYPQFLENFLRHSCLGIDYEPQFDPDLPTAAQLSEELAGCDIEGTIVTQQLQDEV